MSKVTFNLESIKGQPCALYCKYDGQINPQNAYVTIGEDGEVTADYTSDIGNSGTPMNVWHGKAYRFRVSSTVNADLLADWLEGEEAKPLLERLHAGHTTEWDGNNYRGKLTEDASEAHDDFERALENFGNNTDVKIWDAGDWIGEANLSDLWPEGKTAQQAADDLIASAKQDGIYIHDSTLKALLNYAESRFDDEGDDDLRADQVAELVAADLITQEQADERAHAKAEA